MAASAPAGARVAFLGYILVSLVECAAQWFRLEQLSWAAIWLAMPLLIVFLWLATRRRDRLVGWVVLALFFSWLGDTLGVTILVKIGFFFLAQIAYLAGFWPLRRNGVWRRPAALVGYLVALGAFIVWVGLQAGALAPAVIGYGGSLALMALCATGVSRLSGIGAILFLLSDIVLAIEYFISPGALPYALFVNMVLYLPGQALLVLGVLAHQRALA